MFAAIFHAGSGHGPYFCFQIDFSPSRADNFSGTRGCENGKLKSERRDALQPTQRSDELVSLIVWQSGVMLDLRNFTVSWEQIAKMAFP